MDRIPRLRHYLGHRLVKNAAALFIVQVSTNLAPFLVLPYLSRVLSTEHFGLIAFATSFNWYFITLVEYGFNLTATRKVAIYREEPQRISKLFSSVMLAKAMLTTLGLAIMLMVVMSSAKMRPHLPLFCLSYLAVIGDMLFPLWLFQGLQKMENLVWRDLLAKVLSLSLVFAFVHSDGDYLKAAGFQAGSTVVAGLLGFAMVPFMTSVRWAKPSLTDAFGALKEGWAVFLSMAAGSISYSTNVFLLNLKSGAADVAYYSAAYRLVVAVRMFVVPVVTAIYPHISHMAFTSRESAVRFIRRYSLVLAFPFLIVGLVILFGAPVLIRFYGVKYLPAAPLLQILSMSPFLLALQNSYSTFFMLGFGYEKEYSRMVILATVLNFVVLIPLLSLVWPPVAVSLTGMVVEVFMTAATWRFFRRHATVQTAGEPLLSGVT